MRISVTMGFEHTPEGRRESERAASLLDTELPARGTPGDTPGIATRHQKAMIAAALFDEAPTPIKIGRFTIVRELGAGGMGIVYVAYDEQLDRRVAVKLLRGSASDVESKARLQREAQAMARLSHPHVVTVHEVGEFNDQIFVAMEFVDGQDLRSWMKAEPRSWRDVLAMFAQAGEGLAAAHGAGIVHRDFKPDNALVGKDGRVRVADFGLAHAFDATLLDDATRSHQGGSGSGSGSGSGERDFRTTNGGLDDESSGRLDAALTKPGAIMGTPAYMAPEQFAGERTDDRSDQFSFCVALWEALYGRRPFSGSSLAALSYAVIEGRFDAPPLDAGVPSWVNALLLRGLSPAPEKRWPSMRALLDALARDPEVRRRRALRVGSLVSVASLALAGVSWIAGTALAHNARQQYWNVLTEQLLEIERERGLRQASDDALRARDATRMSVYRSYRPKNGVVDHEDPTTAAVLLREVEGTARESEAWVSAANEILGQPIAKHVLVGHTDSVDALAFSPGAEHIYSGSADGTVRRWDLATGRSEVIIQHESGVTDLALDPRGERVVTSSTDHTVREWSPGSEPRVLAEHADAVSSVAFSPDGRLVATSSSDGSAKLIEIDSGRARVIAERLDTLNDALFDAAGERLLTVGYDRVARVWQVSDGRLLHELRGHEAPIFLGRFLPEGEIVTGADDGTVRLWSLSDGSSTILMKHGGAVSALDVHGERVLAAWEDGSLMVGEPNGRVHELPPHAHNVYAANFDPTGARVLTASFDTTARSAAADGQGVPRVFLGNRLPLYRQAVDASGRWYATGCYDGSIRVWDLAAPTLEITLRGHSKGVYGVQLDPSGERLATVGREGELRLWDARDGRALATLAGGNESLNKATFDPGGKHIATATRTGVVELWDVETMHMQALVGHESPVWDVAFDERGELLASASFDRTARVWDAISGTQRLVLRGHQDIVIGVEFEPGGKRLLTYSHDATIRLWQLSDGSLDTILSGHTAKIWMVTRSPDGHTLASASDDHTARIWPSDDSNASVELRSHEAPVWSVEFDPSGERVVTASYDGTARIWTLEGELVTTLHGHAETVWSAQFAPGQRIITVSDDNTVRVWSLLPGIRTLVLSGHGSGVTGLALSPDGLRMYTGSADTTAKIWRLDRLDADAEHLHARLDVVTSFCLSTEQRMRELGEDVGQAQLAAKRCELAFARSGQ